MGKHLWVEEDEFAAALADILGDIAEASDEAVFNLVHDSVELGRDDWRARAKGYGWKYGQHVTFRTLRKGHGTEGHIFSRKPGLPHLLEKGHATMSGGRSGAFPHVKPAAETAFAYVRAHLMEYVLRELS